MFKIIIIFIAGVLETFMFTAWNLSANRKQIVKSTVLMTVYMFAYLSIISYAIKDSDTLNLIVTYALACGAGNYLELLGEKHIIAIRFIPSLLLRPLFCKVVLKEEILIAAWCIFLRWKR